MKNNEKEAYLYQEFLKRLSNPKFWELFKRFNKLRTLEDFGKDCYERLEAYLKVLEGKTSAQAELALNSRSAKELKTIQNEIQSNLQVSGSLRYRLKRAESNMRGMLSTIEQVVEQLGDRSGEIFYKPKKEKIVDSIFCPYCGKRQSKRFDYNECCEFCERVIANPWKPHTRCPACGTRISVYDILNDEAYDLDPKTNKITCDNEACEKRFDWKKHKQEPEIYGAKFCDACDEIYFPDKQNWRKQRLCPACKEKRVDLFREENPNYQTEYRKKRKVTQK